MSLKADQVRAGTTDHADDEKTIREELEGGAEDNDFDDDTKDGLKRKIREEENAADRYEQEKLSRPPSRRDSVRDTENPEALQTGVDEAPDGGMRAWLVVLGVSCCMPCLLDHY